MVAGIRCFGKALKARIGLSRISPRQFSHLFPHHQHYEAPEELLGATFRTPFPHSWIRLFAAKVFRSHRIGSETEVTLPYFGANPRLILDSS